MATHNLFRGGASTRRTSGFSFSMFPSAEVGPNDAMESAAHKTPVHFALTWGLAPGDPCCRDNPCRTSFMAQNAYFRDLETPLAVGDVINAVILPRFTSLIDLFYMNCCPQPGLTMELRVRGNSDSLGGTKDAPVPVTLATLDFGEVTWGSIIPIPTQPAGDGNPAPGGQDGDPGDVFVTGQPGTIFFNQNDMLQLVITSLPPDGIDWGCMRMALSPVVREYLRGDWIDCMGGCCGDMAVPSNPNPTAPVDPAASSLIGPSAITTAEGGGDYTATAIDTDGNPMVNATVSYTLVDNGTGATLDTSTCVTDGAGQCTVSVSGAAAAGDYTVTASVDGQEIGSVTTTVT